MTERLAAHDRQQPNRNTPSSQRYEPEGLTRPTTSARVRSRTDESSMVGGSAGDISPTGPPLISVFTRLSNSSTPLKVWS